VLWPEPIVANDEKITKSLTITKTKTKNMENLKTKLKLKTFCTEN